jgi:alpha-glucosidase (family GH31 glycosyl hydrolase)
MNYGSRDHEFYRWPDVTAAAATAYNMRYRLLTYLYSSFYCAHRNGGTVARPLFFTDPSDRGARYVLWSSISMVLLQLSLPSDLKFWGSKCCF